MSMVGKVCLAGPANGADEGEDCEGGLDHERGDAAEAVAVGAGRRPDPRGGVRGHGGEGG